MLFNTFNFALFLPIVFILYWLLSNKKLIYQNGLLLVASYFFYACWDWRFLFLLVFSTLLDYYTGLMMCQSKTQDRRRFWLWLSIIINLGFLCIFKYYNFFAASFATAASNIGLSLDPSLIKVILPVGISFYTFHGLSYVIDIYKERIKAERNFIDYSVFVSFFPLLVAGPIERATHLLPQIKKTRIFDYTKSVDGLRQILWGLFKKIVIADQCADYANQIFNNAGSHSSFALLGGAVFFTIQIYCDFSGYSDVALGTARLFGIELLRNFAFPYFSRDIAEFWRRWHISLSSWFKDYLYIPLGGSRGGIWMKIRNTFAIFLVSGFWHGANWTYIIWGLLNALFILPSIIFSTNRTNLDIVAKNRTFPTFKEFSSIILTFFLAVFAFIFFRAENLSHALTFVSRMFTFPDFSESFKPKGNVIILTILFFIVEWIGREEQYAIAKIGLKWVKPLRYALYILIIYSLFWFGGKDQQFIYFEF